MAWNSNIKIGKTPLLSIGNKPFGIISIGIKGSGFIFVGLLGHGFITVSIFGFGFLESIIIGASLMFSSTIVSLKLIPTTTLHHLHTGEMMTSVLLMQDMIRQF